MAGEKRQTAYKIRIGDLLNGNIVFDGERFSSLEVKSKRISRINIVCNVIDKYSNPEKSFNSLTVDDGTGQIRLKAFSDSAVLLEGLDVGDIIRVIGWIRHYNDELYVAPEIAIRVDPKWAYVRKLELIKEYGEFKEEFDSKFSPSQQAQVSEANGEQAHGQFGQQAHGQFGQQAHGQVEAEEIIEKEKVFDSVDSPKAVIMKKIKENADGTDVEKLILDLKISVDEINKSIKDLIAEGEIYESRPGFLRSLD
jgi:hypothetical protein